MSGLRDMSPEKKRQIERFLTLYDRKEKARGELPGWFLGPESEVLSEWAAYRYTISFIVKNKIF